MNARRWILLCCALVMAGLYQNSSAAAAPKTQQMTIQEEQEAIIRECKLTDEQQKALKEKYEAKQKALSTWEAANGEKLKAAEAAAKEARKGTDDAAKKKASEDLKTLVSDRTLALSEADKAILAALTPEQKIAWGGYQLCAVTLPRYKKATLTDEQIAKIKTTCALMAKDLSECEGDDKRDKQNRAALQKALKWSIENVILTAEQRALFPPAKK